MSISFVSPSPVLVINDETGAFIITSQLEYINKSGDGSMVYLKEWENGINSPLTPKELHSRMFNLGDGYE